MESCKRIENLQERRIARKFDELEAILKTLPPDRIQALEEDVLMGTTSKDRQALFSDKQRSLGRIRPNWWIDADIVTEIRRRASTHGGNRQDAVNDVLRGLLEHNGDGGSQSEILSDAVIRAVLADEIRISET